MPSRWFPEGIEEATWTTRDHARYLKSIVRKLIRSRNRRARAKFSPWSKSDLSCGFDWIRRGEREENEKESDDKALKFEEKFHFVKMRVFRGSGEASQSHYVRYIPKEGHPVSLFAIQIRNGRSWSSSVASSKFLLILAETYRSLQTRRCLLIIKVWENWRRERRLEDGVILTLGFSVAWECRRCGNCVQPNYPVSDKHRDRASTYL